MARLSNRDRFRIKGGKTYSPWLTHEVKALPALFNYRDNFGQQFSVATIGELLGKTPSAIRGQVNVLKAAGRRFEKRTHLVFQPGTEGVHLRILCRRLGLRLV